MKNERLLSLDVFRGFVIVTMLMVDYPGSWEKRFPIFDHAHWNGFNPPDFIFPSFMFIMGVAMFFSFGRKLGEGTSKAKLYKPIIFRSVLLFVLGYITNIFFDGIPESFSSLRLLGVLQRFAIAYLVVSVLLLHFNINRLIIIGSAILFLYWIILYAIPVPGYGMPDLTVVPEKSISNLAAWIDFKLLGPKAWINTQPYDPEGILSTIPSIVTVIIGVVTGRWLKTEHPMERKAAVLLFYGVLLVIGGSVLNYWLPINKQLWTSSFVLYAGGWSLLIFGSMYWFIDGLRKDNPAFRFFRYFGLNAISCFVLFALGGFIISLIPTGNTNLVGYLFNQLSVWMPEKHASWIFSIIYLACWTPLFWYFSKKNIIIRL